MSRGVDPPVVIDELAALPPPAPPALPDAVAAELARLAPVTQRRPRRQLAILCAVSLGYGAGVLALLSLRRDAAQLPLGWLVAAGMGWLLGFVLPCFLALVPRPGSMMPRWQLAAGAATLASIGFVVLGLAIHPSGRDSLSYGCERFAEGHGCLWIGLAVGLVPVALGAIFLRNALPVGARWIAAALGAGGGALGGLVLHLHCGIADMLHVGLIHGGVVVVAALLAAAVVPRAISPR